MNHAYRFRWLLVVPFLLWGSLLSLLLEPEPIAVEDLFWGKLFGSLTAQGAASYVVALQDLGFLFLFLILYGSFVVGHWGVGSAYYFTRLPSRARWFWRVWAQLAGFCALYALAYCCTVLSIALRSSSCQTTAELPLLFVVMWAYLLLLLLLLALLATVLALCCKAPMAGIVGSMIALCGMVLLALALPGAQPVRYLDPIVLPVRESTLDLQRTVWKLSILAGQGLLLTLLCRRQAMEQEPMEQQIP